MTDAYGSEPRSPETAPDTTPDTTPDEPALDESTLDESTFDGVLAAAHRDGAEAPGLGDIDPVDADPVDAERTVGMQRAIEAMVLVSQDPVPTELMAQLLEQPAVLVERWCEALAASYASANGGAGHGFELVRIAGGWRFQTRGDLAPYVERFVLSEQHARLSGAALETLAIVAYKQPISRAQIASIRGVDPDGVLRTLTARGYVAEVGRDPGPGQAILFGTTETFLEKLGLDSLDDLPPIAAFIPGAEVVEALEHGLRPTADASPEQVPRPVADDDRSP